MCALKAVLDTLDGVSEEMGKHYKAGTGPLKGKYVLDVDGAGGSEEALRKALVEERGRAALERAGGSVPLLLPVLTSRTQVEVSPEGKVQISLVDENGRPRFSPKRKGLTPMSIEEAVEEMQKDPSLAAAFQGQTAEGDKAAGSPRAVKKVNRHDLQAMSRNIEGIAAGTVQVVDD